MTRVEIGLIAGGAALVLLVFVLLFVWRKPRRLKVEKYIADWKELQAFCKDRATWHQALIDADKLLDTALRKRKFKGKRMGERLVAAQHILSNNDSIWAA